MYKMNRASKKIAAFILVIMMVVSCMPELFTTGEGKAYAADHTIVVGEGTEENPYQIAHADQLNDVRNHLEVPGNYFILTADIDLSSYSTDVGWAPINDFNGNIDGKGYTITGLTINRPIESNIGLFGITSDGSSIANMKLENVNVKGENQVGGLVGRHQNGTISNSYVSGSVSGIFDPISWQNGRSVGGLVGTNEGTINTSYSTAGLKGASYIGGLVGENNGTIDNSYATGNVERASGAGGLVGVNNGTISNSYGSGNVEAPSGAGGLVGENNGTISTSYATGFVEGDYEAGGLVGRNSKSISNSYAVGNVNGYYGIGGLVGLNYREATVSNSYSIGKVTAGSTAGGLIGSNGGTINSSFFDSVTSGQVDAGTGRTTAEMKTISTYEDWNFTSEWYLIEGYYPQLHAIKIKTPTANVASGPVAWKANVTLSTATVSAAVYYTIDGSTPSTSSLLYSSPIVVSNDLTIKAIAAIAGKLDSEMMLASYTIALPSAPMTGALIQGTNVGTTKLNGVAEGMEYSINTAGYQPITATSVDNISVIAGDKISIRVKATEVEPASLAQVLTVGLADIKPATKPSNSSGGGGSSTPTDGKLTLPIGQAGQVSLGDTVTVAIPTGATKKELKLTISKLLDTQNLVTNNQSLVSSIYEILKSFPENFSKPVALTFVFDPANVKKDQRVAVFYYDEAKKGWVEVTSSKINGNRISVEVDHFTKFAVFAVEPTGVVPEPEQLKVPTDITVENKFSDIAKHWAEANIKQAVGKAIVKGYADGTFKPNATVTRAEFAVMLMNALKPQGDGAKLNFTDAAKIGAWAKKAVAQGVQAGIIKGSNDGSFRPNAEVTRAEMAVMIANALGESSQANAATGFADDKEIPAWAKGSVAIVKQASIVQGKNGNEFAPQDQTTRAEAVTVILKLLDQMNK
ncbi:S-layer homology domain-containing protein [Cohnella herbarum]|uniref:SLH domain-containing protein n=1 Tax=Cohnella herbarum TaxID=2728023 RepID=A0A7Z2VNZ8_9BACL|nr:S-layer homology domain-containing protein [Cohnella herbarum]QJD86607.1 hypothetical protein HH215_27840 [Cohnella herbarum]